MEINLIRRKFTSREKYRYKAEHSKLLAVLITSRAATTRCCNSCAFGALSFYETAPSVKSSGNNGPGRCQQSLASAGARRHTITIATTIIIIVWAITSLTKLNRQGRGTRPVRRSDRGTGRATRKGNINCGRLSGKRGRCHCDWAGLISLSVYLFISLPIDDELRPNCVLLFYNLRQERRSVPDGCFCSPSLSPQHSERATVIVHNWNVISMWWLLALITGWKDGRGSFRCFGNRGKSRYTGLLWKHHGDFITELLQY